MAKMLRFCVLEFLPECEASLNPANENLVNFLLLKRLHRRILATNEKSGCTGPSNYEGVARFACEYRYVLGARMVSQMTDLTTPLNIPIIVSKTQGVGGELVTHILEFLRRNQNNCPMLLPQKISTLEMIGAPADLDEEQQLLFVGQTFENNEFPNPERISLPSFEDLDNISLSSDDESDYDGDLADAELDSGYNQDALEDAVRGGKWFQDVKIKLNCDGGLLIDEKLACQIDAETMSLLKAYGIDKGKLHLERNGYVWNEKVGDVHSFISKLSLDADFEYWRGLGFPGEKRNLVGGHYDNNRLNFNKSNIKNIPANLNWWSRPGKVHQYPNGKFYSTVRVKGHKQIATSMLNSSSKVIHNRDIIQISLVPNWAKLYLLKLRKAQCTNGELLKTYDTLDSLMACSVWYKSFKFSRKRRIGNRFQRIALSSSPTFTQRAIRLSEMRFNPHLHTVVCYTGSKGRVVYFVVDIEDYEKHIRDFKGNFTVVGGYIQLGVNYLHLLVLNREVGDYEKDLLQGLHGKGGKLDNRSCVLSLGDRSDNNRDKKRKKQSSLPVGVQKNGKKFAAQIKINSPLPLPLGTYSTPEIAGNVYMSIMLKVPEIRKSFEDAGVLAIQSKVAQKKRLKMIKMFLE